MKCGIYKITNITNNKSYIGKSKNIENRWKDHQRATDNYAIHVAMRQYGVSNFTFEIIEECEFEDLNKKEIYWIKYYNSYLNGYNETPGGEGVLEANKKAVNQYDLNGKYLRTFSSITEAENFLKLNYHGSGINSACLLKENRTTAHGYQWRYVDDVPSGQDIFTSGNQTNRARKKVQQFDLNNIFIQEFDNISQASLITGIGRTSISNCLNGYSKTAGNYLWKKVE